MYQFEIERPGSALLFDGAIESEEMAAMMFLKLMAYIVLFVIAVDTFWGGIFAGSAGKVLGVIVGGYCVIQVMIASMRQSKESPKDDNSN